MTEDYVPRPEFDMFCKQQNGSLKRIEAQNTEILSELKEIRADISERVTWDAFDRHKTENKTEHESFRGRPSWLLTTTLVTLASICASLIVALVML